MKKNLFGYLVLAACLLASCSQTGRAPAGIQITDLTVAVGGAGGSGDQQVVSYEVTLKNSSQTDITVRWLEPILSGPIAAKLSEESPRTVVDKTLAANSSATIQEQFMFIASGTSKAEIISWEPFFQQVLISTEMKLALPPQTGK